MIEYFPQSFYVYSHLFCINFIFVYPCVRTMNAVHAIPSNVSVIDKFLKHKCNYLLNSLSKADSVFKSNVQIFSCFKVKEL